MKKALKLCSGTKSNHQPAGIQTNNSNATSNKSIFQINNKLSVFDINKLQIAKFVYKTLNNLSPNCFLNLFNPVANVHAHNTSVEKE